MYSLEKNPREPSRKGVATVLPSSVVVRRTDV